MASFASSATTGGARKHAWTKIELLLPHLIKRILRTMQINDVVLCNRNIPANQTVLQFLNLMTPLEYCRAFSDLQTEINF